MLLKIVDFDEKMMIRQTSFEGRQVLQPLVLHRVQRDGGS